MNPQPRTLHKKKEFISKPLKFMIAVASVASTLGLWGIFGQSNAQGATGQPTPAVPMPTVASLVSGDGTTTTVNSASTGTDSSLNALPVVTQPPATAVTAAPTVQYYPPAPITSTRTSR